MRATDTGRVLLTALAMLTAAASAAPATEPAVPADSLQIDAGAALSDLEEDLGATLDELAAAGVEAVLEDVLVATGEEPVAGAATGPTSTRTRIGFRLRLDQRDDRAPGYLARGEIGTRWLTWRIRGRRSDTEPAEISQSLRLEFGRWRLDLGGVGLGHGFGLLVTAPGRGGSLSADQGLSARLGGPRNWSGATDARAVQGAALSWRADRWQVTVLTGRAPEGGSAAGERPGRRPLLARLAHTRGQAAVGLLVLSAAEESGVSLTGSWITADVRWSWELATWRETAVPHVTAAWQVTGCWRAHRCLSVELAAAATPAATANSWGRRAAVLSGWNGSGWALRVAVRPWPRVGLKALIARALHRETGIGQPRCASALTDLQARFGLAQGASLQMRYRRDEDAEHVFSERFPWQAAALVETVTRSVLVVRAVSVHDPWRVVLACRSVGQAGATTSGRRSLLSCTVHRVGSGGVGWRLAWATAWGDDIDLVSALAPVSGYVLPRHWGGWRSELMLGATCPLAGLELQVAASVRRAQTDGEIVAAPGYAFWWQLRSLW